MVRLEETTLIGDEASPQEIASNLHLLDLNASVADQGRYIARRVKMHAALVSAQHPGVSVYRGWGQVPRGLRTRGQWDDHNRRVLSAANPEGILVWPETVKVRDEAGAPTGYADVRCRTARLYREGQSKPFVPTTLEVAHRQFYDTFVRPCSRERYGYWSESKGHWTCVWDALRKQHVRSHVNGTSVYGVYGGTHTRFAAIDLDLHHGDRDVFLDQLRILLAEFCGREGWHIQVADRNAGGVHLLKVVPETKLDDLRASLRATLQLLDSQHPQQAERARASGMKPLSEVEVYPSPTQVFRLPLCRGRTMLLDRPLALVENARARYGVVQDVAGYIRWLATTLNARCPLTTTELSPDHAPVSL
ncbi:MAG TPA: hypothetical protein PKD86_08990 [Gemmatales bacterium]|nr:hypothetical protein [Gemmatales bacterium]HMP59473.1 hypothetical protein [Gemmatales bacterium]